jgi:putative flippase GtrA
VISPQLYQVVRFGMVGVVNTCTFYGCYLALHPVLPYFAAFTVAFVLSMIGSFFMNTYFTYRTRPTWRKFLFFPLTNLTNYVVTSIGVFVLVEWCHMDDKIAPLLAAVVAVPFTYLLSRRILTHGHQHLAPAAVSESLSVSPAEVATGRSRRRR